MTYRPRATCKRCGTPRSAVGHISRRGNCLPCGIEAETANQVELHGRAGPYYDRWREQVITWAASLPGAVLSPEQELGKFAELEPTKR